MKVRHYKKYVIVKKAKSTIHCTMYGFVYDDKIIKKKWLTDNTNNIKKEV
jgi:hypothetical protein